jgi:hypothetical protein
MDTPSHQLVQDKSKRTEAPELSKEVIDSLKSFVDSLKQNDTARKGFMDVLNDPDAMKSVNALLKDKAFSKHVLSELKNEADVRKAISLLESGQPVSVLEAVRLEGHQPAEQPSANNGNAADFSPIFRSLYVIGVGMIVVTAFYCSKCCYKPERARDQSLFPIHANVEVPQSTQQREDANSPIDNPAPLRILSRSSSGGGVEMEVDLHPR